jgi:hypothetical protein
LKDDVKNGRHLLMFAEMLWGSCKKYKVFTKEKFARHLHGEKIASSQSICLLLSIVGKKI